MLRESADFDILRQYMTNCAFDDTAALLGMAQELARQVRVIAEAAAGALHEFEEVEVARLALSISEAEGDEPAVRAELLRNEQVAGLKAAALGNKTQALKPALHGQMIAVARQVRVVAEERLRTATIAMELRPALEGVVAEAARFESIPLADFMNDAPEDNARICLSLGEVAGSLSFNPKTASDDD